MWTRLREFKIGNVLVYIMTRRLRKHQKDTMTYVQAHLVDIADHQMRTMNRMGIIRYRRPPPPPFIMLNEMLGGERLEVISECRELPPPGLIFIGVKKMFI